MQLEFGFVKHLKEYVFGVLKVATLVILPSLAFLSSVPLLFLSLSDQTACLLAHALPYCLCSLLVWQRSSIQYISYIFYAGIIIQKTLPALICSNW